MKKGRCHWQRPFLVHIFKKCGQNVDKSLFLSFSRLMSTVFQIFANLRKSLVYQAFRLSSTATATATVAPTMGLLPMPHLSFFRFPLVPIHFLKNRMISRIFRMLTSHLFSAFPVHFSLFIQKMWTKCGQDLYRPPS